MNVGDKHFRTIWLKSENPAVVQIIDQRPLPHLFVIEDLTTVSEMATAIRDMHVRGAGLIGAAAGYGMYLAALQRAARLGASLRRCYASGRTELMATRPTAVNLEWAVKRQWAALAAGG